MCGTCKDRAVTVKRKQNSRNFFRPTFHLYNLLSHGCSLETQTEVTNRLSPVPVGERSVDLFLAGPMETCDASQIHHRKELKVPNLGTFFSYFSLLTTLGDLRQQGYG